MFREVFLIFIIVLQCNFHVKAQYSANPHCPLLQACTWAYPPFLTQKFQCTNNYQCPLNFLCCPDCHYQHKICKAAIWIPEILVNYSKECPPSSQFCNTTAPSMVGITTTKCNTEKDCPQGLACCRDNCYKHNVCKNPLKIEKICPEESKPCNQPFTYRETQKYQCILHDQCYNGYVCCPDSCYTHKICKPRRKLAKAPKTCPTSVRVESCPQENRIFKKYGCNKHEDCIGGYICCKDNCYDHKLCKLPNEAFVYNELYKFTAPRTSKEQGACPDIQEKCSVPYSLRVAKKFICFKDEDCKVGQLCCKDSCVKDFKICKDVFQVIKEKDSDRIK